VSAAPSRVDEAAKECDVSSLVDVQLRWAGAGDLLERVAEPTAGVGVFDAVGSGRSAAGDPCDGCDYCCADWPAGAIGCAHTPPPVG
jgi:hypothetical protein